MGNKLVGADSARRTLSIYYKATLRHKAELLLSFLYPLGAILLVVGLPFFASKVLAGIVTNGQDLQTYLILFAGCAIIGVGLNRIGFIQNMKLQAKVMDDLNGNIFTRLLDRSVGYHINRVSGKLVSDAIDFVVSFGTLTNTAFIGASTLVASLGVGIIVVFINSWQLGIYITAVVAGVLFWAWRDSRMRAKLKLERLKATTKLISHLSDTIVNAPTVKTFAQEKLEFQRNRKFNKELTKIRLKDWTRAGESGNNRMAFLLASQFLMMILIIHLTKANPALLATGIFAFTYTFMLTNRLFEVNVLIRQIEESLMQAAPMTDMLQEAIEIRDKDNAKQLKIDKGAININDMSFVYPDNSNNRVVFKDFSLSISSGEKIGLVGPSGGGKTTLTRLLLRFDDITSGEILFDGQNIADVTQQSLREHVAFVPQEPLLFHRTIQQNIAYGRPDASLDDIKEAAKQANAHDFIKDLPDGYDTIVGERGIKLSGGQRQRVAIARAILKDAPILVLDEATSALDSENEAQVQDALWHLMKGRTTLVIAHRLSTIQRMDKIIVLQNGKITETGTHRQLQQHKGVYAKLWKHQSGGFIEE
jgi:ATP-binding cassette, subfamily B, bacterial